MEAMSLAVAGGVMNCPRSERLSGYEFAVGVEPKEIYAVNEHLWLPSFIR